MFISYHLWHLLVNPPSAHPLYRQAVVMPTLPPWWISLRRQSAPLLPLFYLFSVLMLACWALVYDFILVANLVIMLGIGLILFNGVIYGTLCSIAIARMLAREHQRGAWDLLCVLPDGPLGAAWATAVGCMHRANAFRKTYQRHMSILNAIMIVALAIAVGTLLFEAGRAVFNTDVIMMYAYIFGTLLVLYIDYQQAVVLGCLSGIFGGTRTNRPFDAQILAFGTFASIQMGVYVLAAVIGFAVLPGLLGGSIPGDIALLAARLLLFIVPRELIILRFWQIISQKLNADAPFLLSRV